MTTDILEQLCTRERELLTLIEELEAEKKKKQDKEKPAPLPEIFEDCEAPEWCVPIKANVLDFEWDVLAETCQFDVISLDPPW